MAILDEIRERIDIVDLISPRSPLKKAGRTFKGLCPFHPEKTPSFVVYPDQWSYHCFGCGAHGSGVDFVMATQNIEFKDAVAELAGRAGIALSAVRKDVDSAEEQRRRRLRDCLEAANRYFYNLLINSPGAATARAYAAERQLDRATIDAFQLGYSPPGWTDLREYLNGNGFTDPELLAAGLLVERDEGRDYDRFRNRLTFPIRDAEGHLVGFGARTLDGSPPKYLNSPQGELFDKGSVLFGIDRAKAAIRQAGQGVVVEGYMDVIALHQRGIQNVVAAMGTSLTDRQIRALKRYSSNIVLALDADAAGAEATLRGLEVARQALDQKVVPVPTWRGTIRYEQALNASIRVAVMPAGQDPDDVAKQGIEIWQARIEQARPVLDYLLETVAAGLDRNDPKAKSAAAERILPVIAEIRQPVEQAHYRQRLADLLGLTERDLAGALRQLAPRATPSEPPPANRPSRRTPELFCLALVIATPELVPLAAELGLTAADFGDESAAALFEIWQAGAGVIEPEILDSRAEAIYETVANDPIPIEGLASRQAALRDVVTKLQRQQWEDRVRAELAALPTDLSDAAIAARIAAAKQANVHIRALKDRHRTGRPV